MYCTSSWFVGYRTVVPTYQSQRLRKDKVVSSTSPGRVALSMYIHMLFVFNDHDD